MNDMPSIEVTASQLLWFRRKSNIACLRSMCVGLRLENASILDKYTDAELADSFNGIGPDFFPPWLVNAMNSISPELTPVCLIHDVEWIESDGTRESFHESNGRLRRNGKIVAKSLYGFWNPKRYIVMFKARTFSKACEKFGWDTWCDYAKVNSCHDGTNILKPPSMYVMDQLPARSQTIDYGFKMLYN